MEGLNKLRVMSDLPQEMIEEILSRLPVKSLLRFRCVSKAWRSLIGSKRFIKKQLKDSKANTSFAHQRALLCTHGVFLECSLLSLFSKPDIHALGFNFASSTNIAPITKTTCFVGSCNGLVCIQLDFREFVLWNPSTRISKKLPHQNIDKYGVQCAYGFGCDERNGDYKVVVLFYNYSAVYSLKSDSWKKISNAWDPYYFFPKVAKLESGKLHWELTITRGGRPVQVGLEFDLKRDVFEMVELGFCPWKEVVLRVYIDETSCTKTHPSLDECINQGGFMNIECLTISDRSSPPRLSSSYYDFVIYNESLETLDMKDL